jgi:hypothetical protein
MIENDPELNGKYLGTITHDFVKVAATLKEAAYLLKARKISDHPIFPICAEPMEIGQLLIGRIDTPELEWNYYFSFLDEFVQRGLVGEDRIEDFIANYKDPDEFCCLFVVDRDFVNFVYIPYPEDLQD